MSREALLRCEVSDGMFSNERGASGHCFDGKPWSAFVPVDRVVKQSIRVDPIVGEGFLVMVRLPGEVLTDTRFITVKTEQLIHWSRIHLYESEADEAAPGGAK